MSDLRADTQMAVSLLQQLMKNMQGRGDREGVSALIKRLPSLLAVLPPISATMKLGGVEYSFDAPDREQNEGIADAFASSIEWLLLAPHSLSEDDIGAALTAQICLAVKRGGDPLPHLLAVCRVLLFGIQMVPGRSANLLAASPVGELAEFTKGIQEDEDSPAQWLLLQDEFQIPSDPLMPMGHVETAVMILAYLEKMGTPHLQNRMRTVECSATSPFAHSISPLSSSLEVAKSLAYFRSVFEALLRLIEDLHRAAVQSCHFTARSIRSGGTMVGIGKVGASPDLEESAESISGTAELALGCSSMSSPTWVFQQQQGLNSQSLASARAPVGGNGGEICSSSPPSICLLQLTLLQCCIRLVTANLHSLLASGGLFLGGTHDDGSRSTSAVLSDIHVHLRLLLEIEDSFTLSGDLAGVDIQKRAAALRKEAECALGVGFDLFYPDLPSRTVLLLSVTGIGSPLLSSSHSHRSRRILIKLAVQGLCRRQHMAQFVSQSVLSEGEKLVDKPSHAVDLRAAMLSLLKRCAAEWRQMERDDRDELGDAPPSPSPHLDLLVSMQSHLLEYLAEGDAAWKTEGGPDSSHRFEALLGIALDYLVNLMRLTRDTVEESAHLRAALQAGPAIRANQSFFARLIPEACSELSGTLSGSTGIVLAVRLLPATLDLLKLVSTMQIASGLAPSCKTILEAHLAHLCGALCSCLIRGPKSSKADEGSLQTSRECARMLASPFLLFAHKSSGQERKEAPEGSTDLEPRLALAAEVLAWRKKGVYGSAGEVGEPDALAGSASPSKEQKDFNSEICTPSESSAAARELLNSIISGEGPGNDLYLRICGGNCSESDSPAAAAAHCIARGAFAVAVKANGLAAEVTKLAEEYTSGEWVDASLSPSLMALARASSAERLGIANNGVDLREADEIATDLAMSNCRFLLSCDRLPPIDLTPRAPAGYPDQAGWESRFPKQPLGVEAYCRPSMPELVSFICLPLAASSLKGRLLEQTLRACVRAVGYDILKYCCCCTLRVASRQQLMICSGFGLESGVNPLDDLFGAGAAAAMRVHFSYESLHEVLLRQLHDVCSKNSQASFSEQEDLDLEVCLINSLIQRLSLLRQAGNICSGSSMLRAIAYALGEPRLLKSPISTQTVELVGNILDSEGGVLQDDLSFCDEAHGRVHRAAWSAFKLCCVELRSGMSGGVQGQDSAYLDILNALHSVIGRELHKVADNLESLTLHARVATSALQPFAPGNNTSPPSEIDRGTQSGRHIQERGFSLSFWFRRSWQWELSTSLGEDNSPHREQIALWKSVTLADVRQEACVSLVVPRGSEKVLLEFSPFVSTEMPGAPEVFTLPLPADGELWTHVVCTVERAEQACDGAGTLSIYAAGKILACKAFTPLSQTLVAVQNTSPSGTSGCVAVDVMLCSQVLPSSSATALSALSQPLCAINHDRRLADDYCVTILRSFTQYLLSGPACTSWLRLWVRLLSTGSTDSQHLIVRVLEQQLHGDDKCDVPLPEGEMHHITHSLCSLLGRFVLVGNSHTYAKRDVWREAESLLKRPNLVPDPPLDALVHLLRSLLYDQAGRWSSSLHTVMDTASIELNSSKACRESLEILTAAVYICGGHADRHLRVDSFVALPYMGAIGRVVAFQQNCSEKPADDVHEADSARGSNDTLPVRPCSSDDNQLLIELDSTVRDELVAVPHSQAILLRSHLPAVPLLASSESLDQVMKAVHAYFALEIDNNFHTPTSAPWSPHIFGWHVGLGKGLGLGISAEQEISSLESSHLACKMLKSLSAHLTGGNETALSVSECIVSVEGLIPSLIHLAATDLLAVSAHVLKQEMGEVISTMPSMERLASILARCHSACPAMTESVEECSESAWVRLRQFGPSSAARRAWWRDPSPAKITLSLAHMAQDHHMFLLGGEAAIDGFRVRALGHFPTLRLECSAGPVRVSGQGSWYYEVILLSDGLMQIGWAAEGFCCASRAGQGAGDHPLSWAYDGMRQMRWNVSSAPYGRRWRAGDVIGVLLDLSRGELRYSINGADQGSAFMGLHLEAPTGLYPVASLNAGQAVRFNFGHSAFHHLSEASNILGAVPQAVCLAASCSPVASSGGVGSAPSMAISTDRMPPSQVGGSSSYMQTDDNATGVTEEFGARERENSRRQSIAASLIGMGFPAEWALRAAEQVDVSAEESISESQAISWIIERMEAEAEGIMIDGEGDDEEYCEMQATNGEDDEESTSTRLSGGGSDYDEAAPVDEYTKHTEEAGSSSFLAGGADGQQWSGEHLELSSPMQLHENRNYQLVLPAEAYEVASGMAETGPISNTPDQLESLVSGAAEEELGCVYLTLAAAFSVLTARALLSSLLSLCSIAEGESPSDVSCKRRIGQLLFEGLRDPSCQARLLELSKLLFPSYGPARSGSRTDEVIRRSIWGSTGNGPASAEIHSCSGSGIPHCFSRLPLLVPQPPYTILRAETCRAALSALIDLAVRPCASGASITLQSCCCEGYNMPRLVSMLGDEALAHIDRARAQDGRAMSSHNQLGRVYPSDREILTQPCVQWACEILRAYLALGDCTGTCPSAMSAADHASSPDAFSLVAKAALRFMTGASASPSDQKKCRDQAAARCWEVCIIILRRYVRLLSFKASAYLSHAEECVSSEVMEGELMRALGARAVQECGGSSSPPLCVQRLAELLLEWRRLKLQVWDHHRSEGDYGASAVGPTCAPSPAIEIPELVVREVFPTCISLEWRGERVSPLTGSSLGIEIGVYPLNRYCATPHYVRIASGLSATGSFAVDGLKPDTRYCFRLVPSSWCGDVLGDVGKSAPASSWNNSSIRRRLNSALALSKKSEGGDMDLNSASELFVGVKENGNGRDENAVIDSVEVGTRATSWPEAEECSMLAVPEKYVATLPQSQFTLNPLSLSPSSLLSLRNGNMTVVNEASKRWSAVRGVGPLSISDNVHPANPSSWFVHIDRCASKNIFIGVVTVEAAMDNYIGSDRFGWGYLANRAIWHNKSKVRGYGELIREGDTVGVHIEPSKVKIGTIDLRFTRNGHDLGVAAEGLPSLVYPAISMYNQDDQISVIGDVSPSRGLIGTTPTGTGAAAATGRQFQDGSIWNGFHLPSGPGGGSDIGCDEGLGAHSACCYVDAMERAVLLLEKYAAPDAVSSTPSAQSDALLVATRSWQMQWASGAPPRTILCASTGMPQRIDPSDAACGAVSSDIADGSFIRAGDVITTSSKGSATVLGAANHHLWLQQLPRGACSLTAFSMSKRALEEAMSETSFEMCKRRESRITSRPAASPELASTTELTGGGWWSDPGRDEHLAQCLCELANQLGLADPFSLQADDVCTEYFREMVSRGAPSEISMSSLYARASLLLHLNDLVVPLLPLIHLGHGAAENAMCASRRGGKPFPCVSPKLRDLVVACRHALFPAFKLAPLHGMLDGSDIQLYSGAPVSFPLREEVGEPSPLFCQVSAQLLQLPTETLRLLVPGGIHTSSEKLISFTAVDLRPARAPEPGAGAAHRLSPASNEHASFFLRLAEGATREEVGLFTPEGDFDDELPCPSSTTLAHYRALGIMMGLSMRTETPFPVALPSYAWRLLAGGEVKEGERKPMASTMSSIYAGLTSIVPLQCLHLLTEKQLYCAVTSGRAFEEASRYY